MKPSRLDLTELQGKGGESNLSALIDQATRRVAAKQQKVRTSGASSGGTSQWNLSRLFRYHRSTGIGLVLLVAATTITARRRQNAALNDTTARLGAAEKQRHTASQVNVQTLKHFTQSVDVVSGELLALPQIDRPARLKDWIQSCFDRALAPTASHPSPTDSIVDK